MKRLLCAAALLLLGGAQQAQALSTTLVARGGPQVRPGGALLLDIGVVGLQSGGLDAELGAFQMDIHYDPALLRFVATEPTGWGRGLGEPDFLGEAFAFIDAGTPGLLRVGEVSLLDAGALDARQGDAFRLATLAFYVLMPAVPAPAYSVVVASDIVLAGPAGEPLPAAAGGDPFVILQVPEPPTLAVLGLGLAAMAWLGRLRPVRRARPATAPW
jgi:hypothetical protein